jgi:parallel beta-helix repeat protein
MSTITVADRNGLLSAFNAAKGGDTIVLKDGYYGNIRVTADYSSTVTVKAAGALDATIANLTVAGGTNVKFDGIKFDNGVNGNNGGRVVSIEGGSQNIAVVNSEVTGSVDGVYDGQWGIFVRDSNGVTLDNNRVHDVQTCIVIFGSSNSAITNNSVDYFSEDGFKFGGLYNSTVSGNKSFGQVYATAGTHADFMQFQGDATNVRITDNLFLAKTDGWLQGIFANDGAYRNLTIENNLVSTGMLRGISVVDGSSGITVNNNTLLNVKGHHNATSILVPDGSIVNNNITSHYLSGPFGSSLALQNTNPGAAYYVNNYYKNGAAGLGMTLQDLTPVASSAATSKGAISLIQSLLGGAAPAPTPEPSPSEPSAPESGGTAGSEAAVNSGGPASGSFSADSYYNGGNTYSTSAGIAGTSADQLYQSERWGNFKYSVGLENGTYDVTL